MGHLKEAALKGLHRKGCFTSVFRMDSVKWTIANGLVRMGSVKLTLSDGCLERLLFNTKLFVQHRVPAEKKLD